MMAGPGRPRKVFKLERGYEQAVAEALRDKGWEVLTRGWPDLLCVRQFPNGQFSSMAVELKRNSDRLRPDQARMAELFTDVLGIRHYVVREDGMQELLNRKGKVHTVLPGENLASMKSKVDDLEFQLKLASMELERLSNSIDETSAVFELTPSHWERHRQADAVRVIEKLFGEAVRGED